MQSAQRRCRYAIPTLCWTVLNSETSMDTATSKSLKRLAARLDGDLHHDELVRSIYATDASAYQETPLAVAIPRTESDLVELIRFAADHHVGLIPRTAGTSLAGQVVGSGIVVDVSRHFTKVLEINAEAGWVRVQPGVIRNELNMRMQELSNGIQRPRSYPRSDRTALRRFEGGVRRARCRGLCGEMRMPRFTRDPNLPGYPRCP